MIKAELSMTGGARAAAAVLWDAGLFSEDFEGIMKLWRWVLVTKLTNRQIINLNYQAYFHIH